MNAEKVVAEINDVKDATMELLKDILRDYKEDSNKKMVAIWFLIGAIIVSYFSFVLIYTNTNAMHMQTIEQIIVNSEQRFISWFETLEF